MPLDPLQQAVFATLRARRNPDSHVAGATALHRSPDSIRYSSDIDLFHDSLELVGANAEFDAATLRAAGYQLTWQTQSPGFHRAWVARDGAGLKMEWAYDSAFRFFPVVEDAELGYRLHDADLAVNKLLAGVGRLAIRDYIDLIDLDGRYLRLGALAWAACGKDPGLAPLLILNELNRHTRYQVEDLAEVRLREPVSLPALKLRWLDMLARARSCVESLPGDEVGCLYLEADGKPVTPDPNAPEYPTLRRHFGTLRGSWPRPA